MPVSEKDVAQMIGRLPVGGKFVGRREVKELPNILWDDEQVLDLVQGFYNHGTGILVATQKRLLFVDKGMLGGLKVEDFPLDKISSLQYSTGLLLGEITVFTSGNKAVIKNVDKTQTRTFAEGVRARIEARGAPPKTPAPTPAAVPPSPQATGGALTDELAKLGALKTQGLLSEEEFAAAKKKLLRVVGCPPTRRQPNLAYPPWKLSMSGRRCAPGLD